MLVNSIIFWIFFAIFLLPYFTLMRGSSKVQNIWLLVASLVFYSYADYRMTILLVFAILTFYLLGLAVNKGTRKKAKGLTCMASEQDYCCTLNT